MKDILRINKEMITVMIKEFCSAWQYRDNIPSHCLCWLFLHCFMHDRKLNICTMKQPVRQYHKTDDSKILHTKRLWIDMEWTVVLTVNFIKTQQIFNVFLSCKGKEM
jgi:hypothetical protein